MQVQILDKTICLDDKVQYDNIISKKLMLVIEKKDKKIKNCIRKI